MMKPEWTLDAAGNPALILSNRATDRADVRLCSVMDVDGRVWFFWRMLKKHISSDIEQLPRLMALI